MGRWWHFPIGAKRTIVATGAAMYEGFGFSISLGGQQSIRLFVPDGGVDPAQYSRGGPSGITECRVIGDFQKIVDARATDWDASRGLAMNEEPHPNGRL